MTLIVSNVEECVKAIESSFDSKARLLIISALADSIAKESAESSPKKKTDPAEIERGSISEVEREKTAADLTLY